MSPNTAPGAESQAADVPAAPDAPQIAGRPVPLICM